MGAKASIHLAGLYLSIPAFASNVPKDDPGYLYIPNLFCSVSSRPLTLAWIVMEPCCRPLYICLMIYK